LTFGSRLSRAYLNTDFPASRASPRVWRKARTHEVPSARNEMAKTTYATPNPSVSPPPVRSSIVPKPMAKRAPARNMPTAAMKVHR
jgi:hypothetical protein